jgi:hypothetical protein
MLCFLGEYAVIQTGLVVAERVLQLEVYGRVPKEELVGKVLEIVKTQQIKQPVIVLLQTLE